MAVIRISGDPICAGNATGLSLVLDEPLSFWGGLDPSSGKIIDRHHPQSGAITTGRILVLPHGRGSSGASSVLAECVRAGTGPVGIVTREPDTMLVVGALVARELYPDTTCPIVVVGDRLKQLVTDRQTVIHDDGTIEQA